MDRSKRSFHSTSSFYVITRGPSLQRDNTNHSLDHDDCWNYYQSNAFYRIKKFPNIDKVIFMYIVIYKYTSWCYIYVQYTIYIQYKMHTLSFISITIQAIATHTVNFLNLSFFSLCVSYSAESELKCLILHCTCSCYLDNHSR